MKTLILDSVERKIFCPNCYRPVDLPFKGITDETFNGKLKLGCGNCGKAEIIVDRSKTKED